MSRSSLAHHDLLEAYAAAKLEDERYQSFSCARFVCGCSRKSKPGPPVAVPPLPEVGPLPWPNGETRTNSPFRMWLAFMTWVLRYKKPYLATLLRCIVACFPVLNPLFYALMLGELFPKSLDKVYKVHDPVHDVNAYLARAGRFCGGYFALQLIKLMITYKADCTMPGHSVVKDLQGFCHRASVCEGGTEAVGRVMFKIGTNCEDAMSSVWETYTTILTTLSTTVAFLVIIASSQSLSSNGTPNTLSIALTVTILLQLLFPFVIRCLHSHVIAKAAHSRNDAGETQWEATAQHLFAASSPHRSGTRGIGSKQNARSLSLSQQQTFETLAFVHYRRWYAMYLVDLSGNQILDACLQFVYAGLAFFIASTVAFGCDECSIVGATFAMTTAKEFEPVSRNIMQVLLNSAAGSASLLSIAREINHQEDPEAYAESARMSRNEESDRMSHNGESGVEPEKSKLVCTKSLSAFNI